jgi:ATP-dependent Clp protease adaptor protein ClpS
MAGDDEFSDDYDDGSDHDGDSAVATEKKQQLKKPRMYNVLLHNDDYTTMEFVVMILQNVFRRSEREAVQIMLHVHKKGAGVAGTYSFEIAESKASKVMDVAREHEFPLRATVEPQ